MKRKTLLAHSARFGCPEQSYKEHISEVLKGALESASKVAPYTPFGELFLSTVRVAAEYHDLGKVDEANQKVLREKTGRRLPIDHSDAGTAYLLGMKSVPSALCVFSHHSRPPYDGLPSIPEENSKEHPFRTRSLVNNDGKTVREVSDENIQEYVNKHRASIEIGNGFPQGLSPGPTFLRFALSCLVDADHSDTARHYGRGIDAIEIPLKSKERLSCLDAYINSLPTENIEQERLSIRQAFYEACSKEPKTRGLCSCSMPVGTGKTTSVMAHLLMAAENFGLRKVFVVLPFTSIIDQSVKTYRKALVLPGEQSEAVVAAHHHRAEYENPLLMAASFLWDAPITVTTAVQFFETLAANKSVTLRKLHNLAGSAIFIDEAHAALGAGLWPQAWKWLQDLVKNWGCHIVLGSGSLSRFWELPEFSEESVTISEIAGETLFRKASSLECKRVCYPKPRIDSMGIDELYKWVVSLPGPRIVVMNTVQSAAALARTIESSYGRKAVEHISTALAPVHRSETLERVNTRLEQKNTDDNWTLVATTCAEAGLNFSFRSAARELSSLASLIQVGGRVNRQSEYGFECQVWSFRIKEDELLRMHPAFRTSAKIVEQLFNEEKVSPDFCTDAMRREIREKGVHMAKEDPIVKAEKYGMYPEVAKLFNVIDEGEAFTVIIDSELKKRLDNGGKPTRKDFQSLTVRMRKWQIANLGLPSIRGYGDLYFCPPEFYDPLIGYMKGILQVKSSSPEGWIA